MPEQGLGLEDYKIAIRALGVSAVLDGTVSFDEAIEVLQRELGYMIDQRKKSDESGVVN